MRAYLIYCLFCLLIAGCTAGATEAAPVHASQEVSPLATTLATTVAVTGTTASVLVGGPFVTCVPDGEVKHCRDRLLDLSFDYPAYLPSIAGEEFYRGYYSGISYYYVLSHFDEGAAAGGSSRDYSPGRGKAYTDQPGFGDMSIQEICAAWSANSCREIRPGVIFMLILSEAKYLCADAMVLTMTPRALIAVNLPHHPAIHGFGFTASLLTHEQEEELLAAWRREGGEYHDCASASQAAYDEWIRVLQQEMESGTAAPPVQARYDALLHLAQSVEGSYVGGSAP